jgi:HEAT repeat protein
LPCNATADLGSNAVQRRLLGCLTQEKSPQPTMNDQLPGTPLAQNQPRSAFNLKRILFPLILCVGAAWGATRVWDIVNTDEATRQFRDTIKQLKSNEVSERWRAAGNLSLVNRESEIEPAISALVQALGDSDAQVKTTSAQTLGSLIWNVKTSAADKFSIQQDKVATWVDTATRALGRAMVDPEAGVRAAAIRGLETLSKQPNAPANRGGLGGRSPVVGDGGLAKKPTFQPPPELAESLEHGETKWSRNAAQAFYGYLDTSPPPELVASLSDPSPEVRIAAVQALGNYPLNLDSAIPAMLSILTNGEPEERNACSVTLRAAWPTSAVIPDLTGALKRNGDAVRAIAALLLGRLGPEANSAVADLLVLLKEPLDPSTPRSALRRMQADGPCLAARALGSISSSDEVVAALTETLKSDLDYRHGAAAYGLTQIGEPARSAAPALVGAYAKWLKSNDRLNTGAAMTTALGRLAPKTPVEHEAITLLTQALELTDRSIPAEAAKALAKFGKSAASAVPPLRALKEKKAKEASSAAEAALEAIEGTSESKEKAKDG